MSPDRKHLLLCLCFVLMISRLRRRADSRERGEVECHPPNRRFFRQAAFGPPKPPADCPFPPSEISKRSAISPDVHAETAAPTRGIRPGLRRQHVFAWTDGSVHSAPVRFMRRGGRHRPCRDPGQRPDETSDRPTRASTRAVPPRTAADIPAAAWSTTAFGTMHVLPWTAGRKYHHDGKTYNWPWMGPFVGFRYSTISARLGRRRLARPKNRCSANRA